MLFTQATASRATSTTVEHTIDIDINVRTLLLCADQDLTMRLIDVNTLEMREFFGRNIPPYAILSHTWGAEEVNFKEWKHRDNPSIQRKEGYAKILGACRRARAGGLEYVWCDTNCIDKTSSQELTESINSMFTWYHDSVVCYAYLSDVKPGGAVFAQSRWFTRGWTLQELIAPRKPKNGLR
ncbi:heterokaryon incompatibility protein-domain-containing protein [Hypoxylon sp. NC1633]|nr:heterokaryon incompatibility protein-domain-containing protein [Hypoxylon sp. NC1633]